LYAGGYHNKKKGACQAQQMMRRRDKELRERESRNTNKRKYGHIYLVCSSYQAD